MKRAGGCRNPFCGAPLRNALMQFCEDKRQCQLLRCLALSSQSRVAPISSCSTKMPRPAVTASAFVIPKRNPQPVAPVTTGLLVSEERSASSKRPLIPAAITPSGALKRARMRPTAASNEAPGKNGKSLATQQPAMAASDDTKPASKAGKRLGTNRLRKSSQLVTRSSSIQDGPSWTWQFQQAAQPASGINAQKFVCELVRKGPALSSSNNSDSTDGARAFVCNFDEAYLASISAAMAKLYPRKPIRIKAVIGGRQRFDIRKFTYYTRRALSWDELKALKRQKDISVRWSNICDPEHAMLQPLIARLRTLIQADVVPSKEEMDVMIRGPTQNVRAKYTRQADGKWTFKRSSIELRDLAVQYILLKSDVNIRVRCYRKEEPADPEWQDPLSIRAPEGGSEWSPSVSLKSSLQADYEIMYVRIDQRWAVFHAGMRWELIRTEDGYTLRASITSFEAAAMPLDSVHSRLLTDLLSVLDGVDDLG